MVIERTGKFTIKGISVADQAELVSFDKLAAAAFGKGETPLRKCSHLRGISAEKRSRLVP